MAFDPNEEFKHGPGRPKDCSGMIYALWFKSSMPTNLLPLQRKPKKAMTIDERHLARQKFNILHCEASINQTPTKIRENNSTLNYMTPHFIATS